ncbi:MAG TPA: hypothetical protein VNM37_02790 [Candidatus Dormibacteraeota bacterium]|jgi:hypothetical protein|nr:hypothetical protein [Verrucomicrobiae bacterium]HXJ71745.1 hypothetical protein [Candidatus Dormibacteraeota bacterium]
MKELVNQWFEQSTPFLGILACGVRHPDRTAISKTWADVYTEAGVEHALGCALDTYPVLQANRFPPGRLRWVYHDTHFHCERRADGTCLGVFTPKDPAQVDFEGLERFFSEFQALSETTSI